jgi:hypothetical protein
MDVRCGTRSYPRCSREPVPGRHRGSQRVIEGCSASRSQSLEPEIWFVMSIALCVGFLMSLIGSLLRGNRAQISLHRSEDLVGALGPDERLGVLVPGLGPLGNPSGEFGHTVVDTALEVVCGKGPRTISLPETSVDE